MNVTLAQEHIPVFILNGYEDLELFRELEAADLDYLRIHQPEDRAKILTAVQLLHDLQCEYTEQTGYICIIHGSLKTFSSFVAIRLAAYIMLQLIRLVYFQNFSEKQNEIFLILFNTKKKC